ncbi:MAG: electron transport complex subunit RsxC [Candidatus Krumholzibacteriota bacterium]|nr:electron transport complex subunit RsxC [Candidatus Krumholzibacteriota bacterium]
MAGGFFGGVHPEYNKELSRGKSIRVMPLPEQLTVYFSQNLGAPSNAVVKKGEEVKKGQVIAQPGGFVSTPVHSPTSGKIKSTGFYPSPVGTLMEAAVIIPDGRDEWEEGCDRERDTAGLTSDEIKDIVKEAGIVGMGGATFPTHVKLSPPEDKPIDILILNGAECEPYLTSDHRLMLEKTEEILEGASLFARAINVKNIVVAIEKNKPGAIEKMREAVEGRDGFSVEPMEVIYPQGAEKQLIYSITGRKVPAGGLPMEAGALVQNVGTCLAAFEAARLSRPLIQRVVAVTGSGIKNPGNVLARVGTSFRDIIDFCGGMTDDTAKVISGGPMMGVSQYSLDSAVNKGTSGIVLLKADEVAQFENEPCIRCGRCLVVCPMKLNPSALSIFAERMRYEETGEHGVADCIECGSCAYVCPSKRPLVQHFKRAKAEIRNRSKKAG